MSYGGGYGGGDFVAKGGKGKDEGDKGKSKGSGKINAQNSSMPATECIGAGRIEGWFATDAFKAEGRGWGHVASFCYEGDLFFHLQRSPWMRGINFRKKDEVTFEVVEVNGRCEAVKLLTPEQVVELEAKGEGLSTNPNVPQPKDVIGQRVDGNVKSHYMLVQKQNWGFVSSSSFDGQVFWHLTENPDMVGVDFDRDDYVEFDVCLDEQRGNGVRAKNMKFLEKGLATTNKQKEAYQYEQKMGKKDQWLKNWSAAPPPDWECKFCAWKNFGRNKTCNNRNAPNCPGTRPPREEWADVSDVKASELKETDTQAIRALQKQKEGAQAWGSNDDIVPGWQSMHNAALTAGQAGVAADPAQLQAWPALPEQTAAYQQLGSLLPFGGTSPQQGSAQATLALCLGAFIDVVTTHNEAATGESTWDKVHRFIDEVNTVLGEDRNSKHSFAMQLAKQDWFIQNQLEVRYQPGRNSISISGGQGQEKRARTSPWDQQPQGWPGGSQGPPPMQQQQQFQPQFQQQQQQWPGGKGF